MTPKTHRTTQKTHFWSISWSEIC